MSGIIGILILGLIFGYPMILIYQSELTPKGKKLEWMIATLVPVGVLYIVGNTIPIYSYVTSYFGIGLVSGITAVLLVVAMCSGGYFVAYYHDSYYKKKKKE